MKTNELIAVSGTVVSFRSTDQKEVFDGVLSGKSYTRVKVMHQDEAGNILLHKIVVNPENNDIQGCAQLIDVKGEKSTQWALMCWKDQAGEYHLG